LGVVVACCWTVYAFATAAGPRVAHEVGHLLLPYPGVERVIDREQITRMERIRID
jgi:hypothetical protein